MAGDWPRQAEGLADPLCFPATEDPFESIKMALAFDPQLDLEKSGSLMWIWTIVAGYEDDVELDQLAEKFGWSVDSRRRLARLHHRWRAATGDFDIPGPGEFIISAEAAFWRALRDAFPEIARDEREAWRKKPSSIPSQLLRDAMQIIADAWRARFDPAFPQPTTDEFNVAIPVKVRTARGADGLWSAEVLSGVAAGALAMAFFTREQAITSALEAARRTITDLGAKP